MPDPLVFKVAVYGVDLTIADIARAVRLGLAQVAPHAEPAAIEVEEVADDE